MPINKGGQPPNPRSLAQYGPKYEKISIRPYIRIRPHTSVTFPALRLLSSKALSSGRIKLTKHNTMENTSFYLMNLIG
jgi:hypothetical protein